MMEIEKDMDVEGSHILAKQKTPESEKILDYDYKKCAGCSICVALCPKKALQEGPLAGDCQRPGRAARADRPGCLRLLRDVRELLSLEGLPDDCRREEAIIRGGEGRSCTDMTEVTEETK